MNNLQPLSSPHGHAGSKTSQVMLQVLLACVPGTAALWFFFGYGVLINLVWLTALAVALEALVMLLRKRPVLFYLRDYSAVVTAVLLALALPPATPWWLGLTGILFAIVIAKHLFGGLGCNPFNPAMAGYAALLIAYPAPMTRWLLPQAVTHALPDLATAFDFFLDRDVHGHIDAFTGATALDKFRQQHGAQLVSEFWQSTKVMGQWSGAGWEWVNAGFLYGGLYLLYKKIITWHIPVGFLLAIAILAALFYDGGSSQSHGSPLMHLFAGGTMLGAFFIATDPVTAATSSKGRLIYGALTGSIVFVIRAFGAYPDGVAFAILIGNMAVPMIDRFTRPRTFGHNP